MNHILLLAYPAALVIFTCFHARLTRGGRVSDGFLSLEQTHMIQAFACIGVILHHVTQQITAYGIYDKGPISLKPVYRTDILIVSMNPPFFADRR